MKQSQGMQLFVRYQAHPLSLFTRSTKPISHFHSFRFLTHARISREPGTCITVVILPTYVCMHSQVLFYDYGTEIDSGK